MKKKLLIIAVLFVDALAVCAQVPTPEAEKPAEWSNRYQFIASLANTQFSKYQTGGGQNNITTGTIIDLSANRNTKYTVWNNNVLLALGVSRLGDAKTAKFRKADDRFTTSTKLTSKINEKIGYTALLDFRSQALEGLEYIDTTAIRISNIFAPAYLEAGLGATYTHPDFKINLSPLGGKFTFVLDTMLANKGKFGVTPGSAMRSELGARLEINAYKDINPSLNLRGNLGLFMNYKTTNKIDVRSDITASLKATKYIKVILAANYIYDHNITFDITDSNGVKMGYQAPRSQFSNIITIGFDYTIQQKK
jgi:hypothetical protein